MFIQEGPSFSCNSKSRELSVPSGDIKREELKETQKIIGFAQCCVLSTMKW